MKFKSFKVTEEKEINAFLDKNSDAIAGDGVGFSEGYVSFLYSSMDEAEKKKQHTIMFINKFIAQMTGELMGLDSDEKFFRGKALSTNDKQYDQLIMDTAEKKKNKLKYLEIADTILKEVEEGKWIGNMKAISTALGA